MSEMRREAVIGDVVEVIVGGIVCYGIFEVVVNGKVKVDLHGNSKRVIVDMDKVRKV